MKMKNFLLFGFVCCIFSCSCSRKTTTDAFYTYETECLGVALDGSQTLRAWGTGKTVKDAKEQAKKSALRDVLFKGITSGKKDCGLRPLLLEVNAEEKYEEYFNQFFSEDGAYSLYVMEENPTKKAVVKQFNAQQTKCGMVVRVLRSELKKKLTTDQIIK